MTVTPPTIYNPFSHQGDIHSYEMRSSLRGDYFLKRSRIDIPAKKKKNNLS